MSEAPLRIGEVARRAGVTTRTIRYYEELGLLEASDDRPSGGHRTYDEQDVERLVQLVRLKGLLGVSLEELGEITAYEDQRDAVRAEFRAARTSGRRREEILTEATAHLDHQLELLAARRKELEDLEAELTERRTLVRERLRELEAGAAQPR